MRLGQRTVAIEITEIIATTDRCVRARVKRTDKPANFPRFITQFTPGTAWVPAWLASKMLAEKRPAESN